ncbi:MAG: hypothetical protein ACR2QM_00450, partial [Longimicrobiales bacterium]
RAMTDLREGRIQAFLDLEMLPEGRREFIAEMASDPALAAAVDAQRDRISSVETALDESFGDALDLESAEVAKAWTAVASQIGVTVDTVEAPARATTIRRRNVFSIPVAKAAGLLLVAAGAAAAAVPGSPLRDWLENRSAPPPEVVAPEAAVATSTGVRLPVSDGALLVVLPQPLASERLAVSVVDGDLVEVTAGPGTRFSTSQGRIELADVTGPVTVLIPKAQALATVEIGGMVYLRKSGERVEVLQEADSLPSEFVFGESSGATPR